MIDSQPSASRPRNHRPLASRSRQPAPRRELVSRRDSVEPALWKRPRIESVPDSAVTQPLPPRVYPSLESEAPAASFTPVPPRAGAGQVELYVVAALSAAITVLVMLVAERASHWADARAKIEEVSRPISALVPSLPSANPAGANAQTGSGVPVVLLHDLPVERGAKGPPVTAASFAAPSRRAVEGVDRAKLSRALARAARAASSCGPGPVNARVVVTFGASGVPRAVHFGSGAPPQAQRSCVLGAIARARVAPFVGEPVTVAKNLSW